MRTARAIGVRPTWAVLTEAELFDDVGEPAEQELTLATAVSAAVEANLDLRVQDRALAVGEQEVALARSRRRPRVDLGLDGVMIDADRAEASFGLSPQRTLTGSATVTQLLYSDPVWANIDIQGSLQEARIHDRATLRLDIAGEAAAAYLGILRAETLERVQRNNLSLTRTNLELARVRVSVGIASRAEILRWENQIAQNRRAVIDAMALRRVASTTLNRLLNRPQGDALSAADVEIGDPDFISGQERLYAHIDDPWSFATFQSFMAREALEAAPELRTIDALTAAQERALRGAERDFWLPDFGLLAGLTKGISNGGAGSKGRLPGVASLGFTLPSADSVNWFVGFNVAFAAYEGGAKGAERRGARLELERLQLERRAVAERIEQRSRTALDQMQASLAGIDLARAAAEAARENYELALDAYQSGGATILDLLDAQNIALLSEEDVANATYDFLIDLMQFERAIARFDFFRTPGELDGLLDRVEEFFRQATPSRKPN